MRILIAIADAAVRENAAAFLKGDGHEVEAAFDALAALEAVERSEFDRVIFDFSLGVEAGFYVIRRLERIAGSRSIIAYLGRTPRMAAEFVRALTEASRLGGWLYEPFTADDLRQAIGQGGARRATG